MKLRFDEKNDALYLRLDETPIADSEEIKPGVILDFDENNNIIGVEILAVSKRISEKSLKSFHFDAA
jgi:uncharacterized protein YuzE